MLVADDDATMRMALSALVASDRTLELVGVAADADEAVAMALRFQPDVCLLDVDMPFGGGVAATRGIAVSSPTSRTIALSGSGERGAVVSMLQAGAVGYLVKGAPVDDLLEGIRRTARGERTLSAEVANQVADALTDQLASQEAQVSRQSRVRRELRRIVDHGLIGIVFQPIVDLRSGQAKIFEALARFETEPYRTPDVWFAEAGEVGLRPELELAALRAALSLAPALPGGAALSLNVSPVTVPSPALAPLLRPVASRVILEITEHAPVEDYTVLSDALRQLRDLGMRLAVDDAGAGFASLRHILRLDPDLIKVDMALTQDIAGDRASRAVTRALTSFADEIGAVVVAEGVETAEQVAALRSLGVHYGQGFHLGRPVEMARASSGSRLR
ncbi:MAG: EAL domain-containing protein [Actinomycetota bacterium]|nr:EAL domain-containing protein [Actinomycetota bacterium]